MAAITSIEAALYVHVVCMFAMRGLASELGDNLLLNGDFEASTSAPWELGERPSTWKITTGDSDMVRIAEGRTHNGNKAFVFGPTTDAKSLALFTSQHVSMSSLAVGNPEGAVRVSFWYSGALASNLRVLVDISYVDGRYLFARVAPTDHHGNDFGNTCAFIPSYGRIRVIMVHLVVEGQLDSAVYVDDVDMQLTDHYDPSCPLYVEQLPTARHVRDRFLSPMHRPHYEAVTLATQLTSDRLPLLAKTAQQWRGPVSAAILLLSREGSIGKQTRALIADYYASPYLRDHVTIHLVTDDQFNAQDTSLYPVNYLRNVALKNSATSHVFFVDADIIPVFTERSAISWVKQEAATHDSNAKYALIAPLFHSTSADSEFSGDKEDLLRRLQEKPATLESYMGMSHSVVRYSTWYKSSTSYHVDYVADMEPYFIVPRSAPLMHDIYSGYGRDKCAYSRDLHAAGYSFYVLPDAFLVNRRDPPGGQTIYSRSNGLGLRVFLNIAFHRKDIDANFLLRPRPISVTAEDSDEKPSDDAMNEDETATTESLKSMTAASETINCKQRLHTVDVRASHTPLHLAIPAYEGRDDLMIEGIMLTYGTTVYVSVPTPVAGTLRILLPYMHPDAVVSVIPGSSYERHDVSGLFETYHGKADNATVLLTAARHGHPGAAIIHVQLSHIGDPVMAARLIQSAFLVASDTDVIIITSGGMDVASLHSDLCETHPSWTLHEHHGQLVLKSSALTSAPPERVPPPPSIATQETFDMTQCGNVSADIILMTRNRPLQTLAFLESLATHVAGINHVWLVQRADDALFTDAYSAVVSCVGDRLNVTVISDNGHNFGERVAHVLQTSSASSVMLAVDEIIWLRPVDLRLVACLMDVSGDDVGAFQLRLGENLGRSFEGDPRFVPLKHSPGMYTYYPRRMRYDFGYVTNVDGVLMRRRDLLTDLADVLPTAVHPGSVENMWLFKRLHVRSRQWQLVYRHSRHVNNMALQDGRVAASDSPSKDSYDLARMIVDHKRKIDVVRFAESNKFHPHTHITAAVHFIDLVCPLR